MTIGQNGLIGNTNGTSLSSPFLAGLIASLWSIYPELHRAELLDIVTRSSDRYASPDTIYGNGIPDFEKAMIEVLRTLPEHPGRVADGRWSIEPETNVNSESAFLVKLLDRVFDGDAYRVRLLDESGALLSEHSMGEADEVLVPIPRYAWESSRCLYFMIEEPFKQSTYRIGLR